MADFYALQRSRRQFGGSHLDESSEADDDASRGSGIGNSGDGRDTDERGFGRGGGIKSSWRGGKISGRAKRKGVEAVEEVHEHTAGRGSEGSSNGKGKMVDVGLDSTMRSSMEAFDRDEPPDDLAVDMSPDDNPPAFQQFRTPPRDAKSHFLLNSGFIPRETDKEALLGRPQPPDSDVESVPPTISYPVTEPPRHDSFWGSLYLICLASLFASFFLVYLHTSAPSLKHPLGDTIYTLSLIHI